MPSSRCPASCRGSVCCRRWWTAHASLQERDMRRLASLPAMARSRSSSHQASAVLTSEAAATLVDRDPARAKAELEKLQELAREAWQEMRSLIFELRSAELESDGLVATLRKHVEVVSRVRRTPVRVTVNGERRLA